MNKQIEAFRERFNDATEAVERFAIFVRGREFQEQSVAKLEPLEKECAERKDAAIKALNEDEANAFLAFECMAKSMTAFLRFMLALKADDPDKAWDQLISAESFAEQAMKAHQVAAHLDKFIRHLHAHERLLFPKPMFFSTGWTVRSSQCNICGKEYGECDHVASRPYMGQICAIIVKDGEPKEISVVSDPADKRCRVMHFSDDNKWRSAFTYREVASEKTGSETNQKKREKSHRLKSSKRGRKKGSTKY